jgi:DNA-binding NtrC family response regulator
MAAFFLGQSKCMKELEGMVAAAARLENPVLMEGESGTGKETLARHLHCLHGGPGDFLRLYCGREEPWESVGKWLERAGSHGVRTVFLKNVQLLPGALQVGLLHVLQGGGESGVRLIASANEDIENRVRRGEFSADLYFRLSACRLRVPPLRERSEDIAALFLSLLPEGARCRLDPGVERALAAYPWPGNFWELESMARSYVVAPEAERLMAELARRAEALRGCRPGGEEPPPLREQVRLAAKRAESEIILRTLEQHRWNRRRAAKTLKISYRALMYKMKALQGTVWERAE